MSPLTETFVLIFIPVLTTLIILFILFMTVGLFLAEALRLVNKINSRRK